MQENLISLKHHFDDYECMWNGIEDLYIRDTGETLPPNFFFTLSSFGSFCYRKTPKSDVKRMIALGDGRTKQMYAFLAPIAGFTYKHTAYPSFEQAIKKARAEINAGYPVVLGALDMHYLPYYPKLYHNGHIPFHYVLMVGYSDAAQCIYLYDCGREGLEALPYDALRRAWDCGYPGLSAPNTVCAIRMNAARNKCQIAEEALRQKANAFLNPPASFTGRQGFEKFIGELPGLQSALPEEDYRKLLVNMVMFMGTVPTLPNALLGMQEPDKLPFCGGFDKMSRVLHIMGMEYGNGLWLDASRRFATGADIISGIVRVLVAYLTGERDGTGRLPGLFTEVMELMTGTFMRMSKQP